MNKSTLHSFLTDQSMEIQVRKPTLADAESIDRLIIQLGYQGNIKKTSLRLRSLIEDPAHLVLVAAVDDTVTGWIHAFLALRLESDSFAEIGGMLVDERHRNQGIGRLLIHTVQEWALSQDILQLRVRCNTIRRETHAFYTQLGFQETKEQKIFDLKRS